MKVLKNEESDGELSRRVCNVTVIFFASRFADRGIA
jgi:hypothetical protein